MLVLKISQVDLLLKLGMLRYHIPNEQSDLFYEYAEEYLVQHFQFKHLSGATPSEEFAIRCEQAINHMCTIKEYPQVTFNLLRTRIPDIAGVLFSKTFGDEVKKKLSLK